MPIQFDCPHCQTTLRASSAKAGARARCKKCQQTLTIPDTSPRQPTPTSLGDDPFAGLPEFQALQQPVAKRVDVDTDFHRMMLGDQKDAAFTAEQLGGLASTPHADSLPAESTPTTPPVAQSGAPSSLPFAEPAAPADLADVLDQFSSSIQTAVHQQQVTTERAVRAKFSVVQIQQAFKKPLGKVEQLKGLRQRQLRSAIMVALVPIGFVVLVLLSSLGLALLYRGWLYGESEGIVPPIYGLSFIVAAIVVLACWIPVVNLLFAGLHLLFGGQQATESATQLTRESQPVMYEFVDQICDKLGAPKPCRIDLNCEFNATASLARGWLGSGPNDLVLTIGIPLIAVQNTEQLASVIAHEFGHFRQGSAMKTYYVIGSLTHWFMQTAAAGFAYFYFFGYLTHRLSGSLSREMEWDADRHAVHLAGSKAFEESSALLERYGVAFAVTVDNLIRLFQTGVLVDNVPRFMMHIGRTMPAAVIRRIAEETEQQRLDALDSHPPTRDRVKAARELNQPGVLELNRPAIDLIDHWIPLCKTITLDFYTEQLELKPQEINASHVTPLEELLRDEHKWLLDRSESSPG